MANLAAARVLAGRGDAVARRQAQPCVTARRGPCDRRAFTRYAHGDVAALRARLQRLRDPRTQTLLVLTDGVFSMDGDVAPLRGSREVCREARATLLVDDAHGFGVLGETGAGAVEEARSRDGRRRRC